MEDVRATSSPHPSSYLSIFFLAPKVATYTTLLYPFGYFSWQYGKYAVVEENGSTVRSLLLLVTVLGHRGEHKEGETKHRHALALNETDKQIFLGVPCSHLKVLFRSNPINLHIPTLSTAPFLCPFNSLMLRHLIKEGFRLRRRSSKYPPWRLKSLLMPTVPSIGLSDRAYIYIY
jgi:hypothetical protein